MDPHINPYTIPIKTLIMVQVLYLLPHPPLSKSKKSVGSAGPISAARAHYCVITYWGGSGIQGARIPT